VVRCLCFIGAVLQPSPVRLIMLMRWQQWDHHVLPRVTLMLPVIDACRLVLTVSGVCFSSGSVHRLTRLLNHRIIGQNASGGGRWWQWQCCNVHNYLIIYANPLTFIGGQVIVTNMHFIVLFWMQNFLISLAPGCQTSVSMLLVSDYFARWSGCEVL